MIGIRLCRDGLLVVYYGRGGYLGGVPFGGERIEKEARDCMAQPDRLTAVDVFSGAGGSSIGLVRAGFRVIGAIDSDPVACRTYHLNLGLKPLCADVFALSPEEFMHHFGLRRGQVHVMVGCPPCQGFSPLGKRDGSDPRNNLVDVFSHWIGAILPAIIIFENVPGILKVGGSYWARLLRVLERDYRYQFDILNAADYGVAQRRRRLVSVAARRSCFSSPPPMPAPSSALRTVRDAIGHFPVLEAGETHPVIPNHRARRLGARARQVLQFIPPDGGSRSALPDELVLRCHKDRKRGFEDVYGRLKWDRVAPTITSGCTDPTKGRFIHPEQDRGITGREAAALQSFPDDYFFDGTLRDVDRQIGNAFPPLLMERLGETVRQCF